MKLNFIQDIASPHNNVFARALEEDQDIDLSLWYCVHNPEMYGWKKDLTNAIKPAQMYQQKKIDFKFLWYCLTRSNEKYLIVGWQNINTKLLFILFFLLRREYSVWFDLPHDERERNILNKIMRRFFYFILKYSKAHIFGVGQMTLDYFKKRGFKDSKLTNLPIFVDISKQPEVYRKNKNDIFKKYHVDERNFLISAGSRLIYEKGFDILIDAIFKLPKNIKKHIRCVIVGKGEEEGVLKKQIIMHDLQGNIFMEPWMEFSDFTSLIANSHTFVHPCRFDAFGATIFAHALSVPVLGNVNAGAAYDRIVHGENGFLFENDSSDGLAKLIERLFNERDDLRVMGENARMTALKWSPKNGVQMLKENLK
jgi:glycosyltransferase involved in cell wall biosynthesis